jgi:hypothetical protein
MSVFPPASGSSLLCDENNSPTNHPGAGVNDPWLNKPDSGAKIPQWHELRGQEGRDSQACRAERRQNVLDVSRRNLDREYDGPNVVSHEISEAQ